MAHYLASLKMSVFVSDYDHNAPTPEYLHDTHLRLYQIFREKQPDTPYLIISKPDYRSVNSQDRNIKRREIIVDTYRYARDHGDTNVYYIDGSSFFRGPYAESATVDGCHPNDLGFALMADAIESELRMILTQHLI
jgi:lysophospholipase L1-like esterase